MRVGIFVPGLGVKPGYENSISAHMQIPLRTAIELQAMGHEVAIIATMRSDADVVLPAICAELPPPIVVRESRRRSSLGSHEATNGYRVTDLATQMRELRSAARQLQLDVLHLFGFERIARFAGILGLTRFPCPVVATVLGPPGSRRWKPLYSTARQVFCSTEHTAEAWRKLGIATTVARHGVVRDLRAEVADKDSLDAVGDSVVYWRIANHDTGGDIVKQAFAKLAPLYPHLFFRMILRPAPDETEQLDECAAEHPNWTIDRFPYKDPALLSHSLSRALFAVFPYRSNTVDPQMSIAETLDFGVPCIVSDVRSNPELIAGPGLGLVASVNSHDVLVDLITEELRAPTLLRGLDCRRTFREGWSWPGYGDQLVDAYASISRR